MSIQTSILSFFSKSPATRTAPLSTNSSFNNSAIEKSSIKNEKNSSAKKQKFGLYDLIWARLEGYPHWPALVCRHPGGSFFKKQRGVEYLNCQFFDNPPQRAWIKVEDCILLIDDKHPKQPTVTDERLKQAIVWSLEALNKTKEERSNLVLVLNSDESEAEVEDLNDEPSPLNKSSRIITKRKFESDSEPEDLIHSTLKKKKKLIIESDDSEDDYKPSKFEVDDSSSDESLETAEEELDDISVLDDESMESLAGTPVKKKSSKKGKSNKKTASDGFDKENKSFNTGESFVPGARKFSHESFDFLKPENIKDKHGRRPDHPDYDPKTLYVPDSFLNKQTQTQQQWWIIKRDHFDTLLFFKMGKFYELYHQDAVIICELTNIIFMKGKDAHAGFPERAYQRFADVLIDKGYKVARVEQTETAEARDKRCKEGTKEKKCVRREVCRITSLGTRSLNENDSCADNPYSSYILAITEKESDSNQIMTGLCFVDASIGKFHIGQLVDDKYSTLLRTIFSHYPPVEILVEKDHVTSQTLQTIKSCLPNVLITYLKTDTEFWKTRDTLRLLIEGPYFKVESDDGKVETKIPEKLKNLLDPSDTLNLTVKSEFELAIKAMGAIIYQLKRNLIEEELLSKNDFNIFDTNFLIHAKDKTNDFMVLDSVTIKNLELFENSIGGQEGTLLQMIDTCKTKFGKRRLRKWLCSPLCSKKEIDDRLNAVNDLMNLTSLNDLHQDLKKLPDLERILLKIHTQSLPNRSKNHPDSRAVMMDASYNKTRITEFCKLIEAFKHCDRFIRELKNLIQQSDSEDQSVFLTNLITYKNNGGVFPNTVKTLTYFENSFDHRLAKEKGIIQPKKGVNKKFEKAEDDIKQVHQKLNQHLKDLCIKFGEKLTYIGNGKNRFQIEFPAKLEHKISGDFEKTSQRIGFNRYQDKVVKSLLVELKIHETEKTEAMQESWRVILHAFMEHSENWMNMIKIIAVVDCLISLANYANSLRSFGTVCRPTILETNEQETSVIRFKGGLHPSLIKIVDNFMANDVVLDQKLMLLTGANMSGKSTLMRQTGLLTVLAHIGSMVPAEQFETTIVDRIFTRLGATDRILEGESTFFVELSETSTIIKHATKRSLILLDELGRGTSSIDGTSIACSVVNYLSNKIACPTMFSTHYSSLVEEFKLANNIIFSHMGCVVENEDFNDPTNETITFLYKLVENVCPKSFGFNAAKLAGVPDHVIRIGFEKAKQLETELDTVKLLTKLVNKNLSIKEARQLITHLVS